LADVIAEHEPILQAIERRDPDRARAAMASHLERLLDDISEIQTQNPEYFDQPT
jgi:DNA-binding GntR family transcriptional regulator